ncbi:MAG: NAD(P)H-dependent oxidoreductase [Pseudomonadota bacterium]
MRALVVYCHPSADSFTAAVRGIILDKLEGTGAEVSLVDLYEEGFEPVLSPSEWTGYLNGLPEGSQLTPHCQAVRQADTVIFVYPTWWYGLPAILKGWLDRVLLPDVAFRLSGDGQISPALQHIRRIGVFTTCGATWAVTRFVGSPGRRTLLRGFRLLCARGARTVFCAHYAMDRSTAASRARHLQRVARAMDRLIGWRERA